jgi:molybdate transport system substrate-binding protein
MRCVSIIALLITALACLFLFACRDAASAASAGERSTSLRIAAASAMRPVMDDLLSAFAAQHPGIDTRATFGASGNLCAQIANRAPFDLFLASDLDYPGSLAREGQTTCDIVHYATGSLVLWIPGDSALDASAGLALLGDPRLRRIAIATPRHAPYGRAAANVLRRSAFDDTDPARLILGENVEQAAKFAHTGAADAALIPLSKALTPAMRSAGRFAEVPPDLCPGVQHGAVILHHGRANPAAQNFLAFLTSDAAARVLAAHGLTPAEHRKERP